MKPISLRKNPAKVNKKVPEKVWAMSTVRPCRFAFQKVKPFVLPCRTASFVSRARMKISCCCATAAIEAIIRTVLSRAWIKFQRVIGKWASKAQSKDSTYNFILKRYCFECLNKATGERKCIVCGGQRPPPFGKMIFCELCPRAYHSDCYIPPMLKVPRGKWYCQNCASKAPPKKRSVKKRESTDAPTDASKQETTPTEQPAKEKKKKKEKKEKDKENSETRVNNSVSSVIHNDTPLR